jgi:hypothetical protein
MKIEASKNNAVERRESSKNVFKTEQSVFDSTTPKAAESVQTPTGGAFAKILEETRRDNEKDNSTTARSDSGDHDSQSIKTEAREKVSRDLEEKKDAEERGGKNGDAEARQNGNENQSPALAIGALNAPTIANFESTAPAARSILHVADLERIVSTIRTETFENQKQITIALKNSVLQGLQIRLTLEQNGKVKAEFLASGEQIKKHLKQRKKELQEIFVNRSALFSEVEIGSLPTGEQN